MREMTLAPGTLVAVASFSTARRWLKESGIISSYEWIRYASLSGVRVVGGMGKVLKHFIEETHPGDIMTYSDPDSVDGGRVYKELGFISEGIVEKKDWRCEKLRFRPNYPAAPKQ